MSTSPDVHIRVKLGMVEIDDVNNNYRPDVDVFFYFKASSNIRYKGSRREGARFENIEKPSWVPNFDFENEVDEMLVIDECYWIDNDAGLVFGRRNMVPHLQERFDHHAFPFDRQVLDVKLLSDNCLFQSWKKDDGQCPLELRLQDERWQIQGELNALADSWNLKKVTMTINNDENALSSVAHLCTFLERRSKYYMLNIGLVLFLIILAQACMVIYPFNETRFTFTLQLLLVSVAFKFVTQSEIPKINYTMNLDRYIGLGMLVLFARLAVDTYLQATFEVPIGEDGYRGKCDANDEEITICMLDVWATIILTGIWLVVSFYFLILGPCILRPRWKSLTLAGKKKRLRNQLIGKA